jgi:hypothetical protein
METQNLWPNFTIEKVRGPKTILQEQAGFLKQMTQGVLNADVLTRTSENQFYHFFRIISPSLNNYKYTLFTISHGADSFPVNLDVNGEDSLLAVLSGSFASDSSGYEFKIDHESGLTHALSLIFQAPSTMRIIQNLYSQSLDEQAALPF